MIKGTITALVTPFTEDGLDETAFQDFVEWQVSSGVHGVVPCGTTGESATLTDAEHKRVIELTVEVVNGRVPVIAGAGSNETRISIRYAQHAKECGADAALVVTPYYNKPNQEGIFQHFKAINDNVDLPIIVYNIPGRSVVDITNETMGRLAQLPQVIGCKDATGDVTRVTRLIDLCGEDFIQLSGDDPTVLGYMAHGGKGVISVGANIAPAEYVAMTEACMSGEFVKARKIHASLDRLHKDLFLDPNPAPAKYAASLLGKMDPRVRLPMTLCQDSTKAAVKSAMTRAGLTF